MKNHRIIPTLLVIAYTVWVIIYLHQYMVTVGNLTIPCLFDDAMISMRVGENIATGQGPVWNPGEHVECYTNPLMVVLMAGLIAVTNKFTALHLIQWVGLATILGTAWFVQQSQKRQPGNNPAMEATAIAAVLSNYALSYWGLFGMETGLSAVLLAALFWNITRPGIPETKRAAITAILLPLIYLTRPDHILYAGPILLYGAWDQLKSRKIPVKWILAGTGTAAVIIAHLLWRHSYYGEWQPNTAILKLGGFPLDLRIANGWAYIKPYLPLFIPITILVAIGVLKNPTREKTLAACFAPIALAYQIYVGGDAFERLRIITPTMPLLVTPLLSGAVTVTSKITPRFRMWATAMATLAAVVITNGEFTKEQLLLTRLPANAKNQENIKTGLILNAVTHPDATLAVFWAGALPYFAERRTYDMLGKCDAHIAKTPIHKTSGIPRLITHPGHNKYDLSYSIVEKRPEYVQNMNWGEFDKVDPDWATKNYGKLSPLDVNLILRKDSNLINWNLIVKMSPQNPASGTNVVASPHK